MFLSSAEKIYRTTKATVVAEDNFDHNSMTNCTLEILPGSVLSL